MGSYSLWGTTRSGDAHLPSLVCYMVVVRIGGCDPMVDLTQSHALGVHAVDCSDDHLLVRHARLLGAVHLPFDFLHCVGAEHLCRFKA